MKKVYNLLAVMLIAIFAFSINTVSAQDSLIWSQDFTVVTGSGTQQCGASGTAFTATTLNDVLPGWSSEKAYPANGKIKLGTSSVNGWIETPSINLSNYGTVRIVFDAKAWNVNGHPEQGTTLTVSVGSTDYTVEGLPNVGSTDTTTDGFCDMGTFEILAAAGAPMTIKFQASPRAFIDNIAIYTANGSAISVLGNTTFSNLGVSEAASTTLTAKGFNLTAAGNTTVAITGDSHFTTTTTTIANNDLMSENGFNIPVAFSADAAGTYTATLTLSNSDLETPATVTLSANVIEITEIATIDQLRNLIDHSDVNVNVTDSAFYKYTGQGYVTQFFSNGNRWIQDETGAIQLYDPNGYFNSVPLDVAITNLVGHLSNYYGYVEFKVEEGPVNVNPFPTFIPEPVTLTFEQLQDVDYMNSIQGQLIKLENVSFTTTGNFVKMTRYELNQNGATDTAVYFTSAADTHVGTPIPTGTGNIIGVNMLTNAYSAGSGSPRVGYARYYILPKTFNGFVAINESEMLNVKVFPNPTTSDVTVVMPESTSVVAVYNMMGELVDAQTVTPGENTVRMNHLTSGIYYLCFTNGTEILGTAKVVKK